MMEIFDRYGILIVTLIVFAAMIWLRWLGPKMAGVISMEGNEYQSTMQKQKHTLIDVRSPDEFASGHAPKAKLIPLGELSRRLDEIPRDKPIVVLCASGQRSAMAATTLAKAGFKPVYNFSGGMSAWAATGLPVSR